VVDESRRWWRRKRLPHYVALGRKKDGPFIVVASEEIAEAASELVAAPTNRTERAESGQARQGRL
jgi:hypothetical protein